MSNIEKLKDDLFHVLSEKGAKLIGIADLLGIIDDEKNIGVSVAVPLPPQYCYRPQNSTDERILRYVLYFKWPVG